MFKQDFSGGEPHHGPGRMQIVAQLNNNNFDTVKLRFENFIYACDADGRLLIYTENNICYVVLENCTIMSTNLSKWQKTKIAFRYVTGWYPKADKLANSTGI